MKLDFFLLADQIERGEDEKLSVVGGLVTHVRVDSVPTQIRLASAARLLIEDEDSAAEQPFELFIRLVPPEGVELRSNPVVIPPEALSGEVLHPGEERSVLVIGDLNGLPIAVSGLHRLQLVLNDEVISERSLVVIVGEASS